MLDIKTLKNTKVDYSCEHSVKLALYLEDKEERNSFEWCIEHLNALAIAQNGEVIVLPTLGSYTPGFAFVIIPKEEAEVMCDPLLLSGAISYNDKDGWVVTTVSDNDSVSEDQDSSKILDVKTLKNTKVFDSCEHSVKLAVHLDEKGSFRRCIERINAIAENYNGNCEVYPETMFNSVSFFFSIRDDNDKPVLHGGINYHVIKGKGEWSINT